VWRAVAPLLKYQDRTGAVGDGVELAEGVVLKRTPAWVRNAKVDKVVNHSIHEHIQTKCPFALQVDYEALHAFDPYEPGSAYTKRDRANFLLSEASRALWLAKPAQVGFEVVMHTSNPDDPTTSDRASEDRRRLLAHVEDAESALDQEDFERARQLHEALLRLDKDGTVWTATRTLFSALANDWGNVRFLFSWVALEALFGPDDAREMTYRLAQRIAFFLEPAGGHGTLELRDKVTKSYRWRSKLVHGARLQGLKVEEGSRQIAEAQQLARGALVKILLDPALLSTFDSKGREKYLDALPFRE